ncbi:MAG TPA: serine hydrolase [Thermomicrobiaceae bacterium]|nr:serine hydrolase [Thermomicrobiaceae bacterium]
MDELLGRLNGLCDELPFHTGWYLKDLTSGAAADRAGAVVGPSASTRKVAVLMTALKHVHEGKLSLDQPVTIQAKYQHNNSGCFQFLQPGFTIPLRDCLIMMIIVSDNTCTGTIVDMVGIDEINAFSREAGMVGTTHRHNIPPGGLTWDHPVEATNATTPQDVGLLLGLILQGASDAGAAARLGSTPELCRYAIEIMTWQQITNRFPLLMPPEAKIAHKTGKGVRNFSDVGIIFRGEEPRYILSAFTDRVPPLLEDGRAGRGAAYLLIAQLCRACWDALGG